MAVVLALTLVVFGPGSSSLGFYSDDAGFLTSLPNQGVRETVALAQQYVPGRNLHVIWQRLIFAAVGSTVDALPALHLVQVALDAVTVGLLCLVERRLGLSTFWAAVGATLFAVYPNHGETHFWLSSTPMNQLSTAFLLLFVLVGAQIALPLLYGGRPVPRLLAALQFVFFICALFTYDQTFFALALVLGVQCLIALRAGLRRAMAFALTCPAYLAAAAWYISLKLDPATGPTLNRTSPEMIATNVRTSISATFGTVFQSQFDVLWGRIDDTDKALAMVSVGVFVVGSMLAILRAPLATTRRPNAPLTRPHAALPLWHFLALSLIAVLFYFAAYGPAYLWFVSPRHNFLPTVGLALAVASLGQGITDALLRVAPRQLAQVFCGIAAAVAAVVAWQFASLNLGEKHFWIDSYQLRAGFYRKLLAQENLTQKSVIVFDSFPANLGPAHFFGQENNLAINYMSGGRVSFQASALSAVETTDGYFINTEVDRYGPAGLRFEPAQKVFQLFYLGVDDGAIAFSTHSPTSSVDRYFTVRRTPAAGASGTDPAATVRSAVVGRDDQGNPTVTVDVDLGSLQLRPDQELGLILLNRVAGKDVAMHIVNASQDIVVVPVGLVSGATTPPPPPGVNRFTVTTKQELLSNPASVSLYVYASDAAPRLIGSSGLAAPSASSRPAQPASAADSDD